MTSDTAVRPLGAGSFRLVWTLVTRAIGLTAGLAIALLLAAALIARP